MARQTEIGFGRDAEKPSEYDQYKGKCVCAHVNGNCIYGVLTDISETHAYFKPSLVSNPDGTRVTLDHKTPTQAPLPLGILRPIRMSWLEEYVAKINKKNSKKTAVK